MQNKPHIAFVDPFSSARYLAQNLRSQNIIVSAIYTVTTLQDSYLSFQPDLFDHVFYLDDHQQLEKLIDKLKVLSIDRVYYGSEVSVYIADVIANAVTPLFANSLLNSNARRDKYLMQETLRELNIPCTQQIKINSEVNDQHSLEFMNFHFPVIIKPVNSVAGIGVELAESIEEIHEILQKQITTNIFGKGVNEFVIQEYLRGTEYFIDTFSQQGNHLISGVQRYDRTLLNGKPICTYTEVMSLENPDVIACVNYVKEVLSAVGLLNGFGHTEVMLTEKGPYLIEVNPRISGGNGLNNALFKACGNLTQVDLLAASCLNKKIIPTEIKSGRKIILYNFNQKTISHLNQALLQKLPSYLDAVMLKKSGTNVPYPKSLIDAVGFVILAHASLDQLSSDHQRVLEWQSNGELF